MAQASVNSSTVREESALLVSTDEEEGEISSIKSMPVTRVTSGSSSGKARASENNNKKSSGSKEKNAKTSTKSSSSSVSRATAKLTDLSRLEEKLSGQIENRFSSLDGKFERLFGLLSASDGADMREPSKENVDNGTSGVRRPQRERTDTSGGRAALISLDNSLDRDFGLCDQEQDDIVSLQPGQVERQGIGLLSSEEGDNVSCVEQDQEQVSVSRFQKYSKPTSTEDGKENEPLTHDILREMFGDDARTDSSDSKGGLCLDKAQISVINLSWRCQTPDKISAYKESSKQSFPVGDSAEKILKVPSLDDLSERLLIKKHGRKAAFGSSQCLYSQPYKSMERIAYQGQVAARMGIISICYTQQALGNLLNNLKSSSPNLDEAVQNGRDIFAMSTKSLDQMSRTGAFHHLNRRKATIADTGLHEFKDLQKTAITSPLSGEGIFGPEFEKKLKDRQEKDKQLSELMPEMNKKFYGKRKTPFSSDSSNQKKPRQSEDSYKSYNNRSSNYGSGFRKPKTNSYSSNFKSNTRNASVSSFRLRGDKNGKA